MYVVRISDFLNMSVAEPHQLLMAKGQLFEYQGSQTAVFVSHQWCARRHADPRFLQLRVLQRIFENAARGTLTVHPDMFSFVTFSLRGTVKARDLRDVRDWVMWYDYFSAPQPDVPDGAISIVPNHSDVMGDLGKAIASLSTYVGACSYFIALAPTVRHESGYFMDYSSWMGRGWCRFERLARQLSTGQTTMLLAQQEDTLAEIGAQDFLMDPVGLGQFGVEEDKARLGPIVQSLLRCKLESLLASGRLEDCRNFLAWCTVMMDGLPVDWKVAIPSALAAIDGNGDLSWLPFDGSGARFWGPLPLLIASGIGDTALMRAMIERRADVAATPRRSMPVYFKKASQQALHIAALHGHIAAISLLLDCRAEINATDMSRSTPLMLAAASGKRSAVRFLLESHADLGQVDSSDISALHTAAIFDRPEVVHLLLGLGASVAANRHGTTALHNGIGFRATREVVRALVSAGTALEDRIRPERWRGPWICLMILSAMYRLRILHTISIRGYNAWGATPLMIAVISGNAVALRELLSARADALARNDRGNDVLQLARICGATWAMPDLAQALLEV